MARKIYPEPYESYVVAIEQAAAPLEMHYIGRGCVCAGAPLVYSNQDGLKLEIFAMRSYCRLSRKGQALHPGMLTEAGQLTNLIQIL